MNDATCPPCRFFELYRELQRRMPPAGRTTLALQPSSWAAGPDLDGTECTLRVRFMLPVPGRPASLWQLEIRLEELAHDGPERLAERIARQCATSMGT